MNSFNPLTNPMRLNCYYAHITDENTEAQKDEVSCLVSHIQKMVEPGFEGRQSDGSIE